MDLISKLPRSAIERPFRAPQLSLLLRSGSNPAVSDVAKLNNFIEVEEFLCRKKNSPPVGAWSALGDYAAPCADRTTCRCPSFPAQGYSLHTRRENLCRCL